MQELHDKLILFISCFTLYLFEVQLEFRIIPILLILIISSLSTYLNDRRVKLAFFLIFIAICQISPFMLLFLPLAVYDIAHFDYQFLTIIAIFPFISNFTYYNLLMLAFTLLFLILSWILKYKSISFIRLKNDYNEQRDTSTEFTLLQEQKNQSILENQDYEINLATLNERNRISKDIHDNIGHLLSRSLLQIGALLTVTHEDITKEGLSMLKSSISDGMDSIRNSIHNMYEESIDLYTAIDTLVKDFNYCDISFEYDINGTPDTKLKYAFIAIVKEGLNNIIKHSKATKVIVNLREHPAMYQLIISDNGEMEDSRRQKLTRLFENQIYYEGIGIQNITDRVKGFQGNINISLDKGFKIFITIPKRNT
ncbi:MAG: two-component sensor histidine kinase [Anaerocolumna sp.]|nr:two-component sensor histidine kinase [Anaerocolumna sp.]